MKIMFNVFTSHHASPVACVWRSRGARNFIWPRALGKARNFSKSQSLDIEGEGSGFFEVPKPRRKLEILPSPRAYMEETVRRVTPQTLLRSVLRQQVVSEEREESEIVQRPRDNGGAQNLSTYFIFLHIPTYPFMSYTYFFIFPTYSFIFLLILHIFLASKKNEVIIYNFPSSYILYRERDLGSFSSPRA